MKKFEYMVLESFKHDQEINKYGDEGWELISVVKQIPRTITAERYLYYFKREIQKE
ncbi:hypothetical protein LCGC14_2048030 [marine sediment metagenome]|uniref:DUF4177 domain-containing protein n=1 Tax=marine sediment metagenome TaxID=412755 RepID=A0A0F9H3A6_9ZZZZ